MARFNDAFMSTLLRTTSIGIISLRGAAAMMSSRRAGAGAGNHRRSSRLPACDDPVKSEQNDSWWFEYGPDEFIGASGLPSPRTVGAA